MTAPTPTFADLFHALDSAHAVMAFDSRDWSETSTDAWLWGILVGWDDGNGDGDAAMAEVSAQHGWSQADVDRLRAMHAAVAAYDMAAVAGRPGPIAPAPPRPEPEKRAGLTMPNMDAPADLAAATGAAEAYSRATDAEIIYDQEAYNRAYTYTAHVAARHLQATLSQVSALRADVARLEGDKDKLKQTIDAFPDANNAANLAHARAERDQLRIEARDAQREVEQLAHELGLTVAERDAAIAKAERDHIELRDRRTEDLNLRGTLSPNGYPPQVPVEIGPTLVPAIEWLLAQQRTLTDALDALDAMEAQRDEARSVSEQAMRLASQRADELAEATPPPDGTHRYVSTGCLHGKHHECATEGKRWDGTDKIPATCKWCGAPCQCTECDHMPTPTGEALPAKALRDPGGADRTEAAPEVAA